MTLWAWDEAGELEANFWLPGEEHPFYGRLSHSREAGPRLHLFDCVDLSSQDLGSPLPPGTRLFGERPGGLQLTIEGFTATTWTRHGLEGRHTTADGWIDSVLEGRHTEEDFPTSVLTATLYGLTEALVGGETDRSVLDPHKEGGKYSSGDSVSVDVPSGVQILFYAGTRPTLTYLSEQRDVHSSVQISAAEPMLAGDLEQGFLAPVRELISFATHRPSYVTSLGFHEVDPSNGVSVLRRPWPLPVRDPGKLYRLALNLGLLHHPEEVVRRWFHLRAEVGPVWSLYFATIDPERGYLDNRFLNLMAFAEGYHRTMRDQPPLTPKQAADARAAVKQALVDPRARKVFLRSLTHANGQTQRERLLDLAENALDVFDWDFDAKQASRAMVDTRNWMIHWGGKTKHVDDSRAALARFCGQLDLIAYTAILRDLELDDDEIVEAVGHGWVLEGLP